LFMHETLKHETLKDVLEKIKPGKEEEKKFKEISGFFLKNLNSRLKNSKAVLGGSGAKGTWLSGNHDVDIFVLYDYKGFAEKSGQLSDFLEPVLKKMFNAKIERMHGSRDYFKLVYENLNFEVVPILRISKSEQAVNITDISPLHSQWVARQNQKIKDEIRILKQFCIANKLYGAESYINGFSGYVLEILTIFHGSFEKVLKAAQKWKNKEIIDPSKFYNKKEALFHINRSKLNSPIIVVDPVDKTRNAAAALSQENLLQFKKLAGKYLKNHDVSFFQKDKITLDRLSREKGHKLFLQIIPLKGKEDVVGVKLLKTFNHLNKRLENFEIRKSGWEWCQGENAEMYFVLSKNKLAEFEERQGPPLNMQEAVKAFKNKNKNNFTKKDRIFAKVQVKYPQLADFAADVLKDEYVGERIKKVKKIEII